MRLMDLQTLFPMDEVLMPTDSNRLYNTGGGGGLYSKKGCCDGEEAVSLVSVQKTSRRERAPIGAIDGVGVAHPYLFVIYGCFLNYNLEDLMV